ncbi:MAG: bifunctional UDP-N-acetylglucosamine diphosphorylase/glucosamine-1-phosphate N-acetyltransferase GlmU [Nitrospirota bacterium]|nr:bifunctional UDP-N-acetylglucosamine diphosphorylase/glucosamine-1-phosphate N-acetyltransferase GlmU [Nitrospirota bacterium]
MSSASHSAEVAVVILAAGLGTRMKSSMAKVLHPIVGKPLIAHVLKAAAGLNAQKTVLVLGHQADRVAEAVKEFGAEVAIQAQQLGTGHAVMQAEKALEGFTGDVVILSGDVPLIRKKTIVHLVAHHEKTGNALTMMTAMLDDATGYGRVVKDAAGRLLRVVEHKDATEEERAIREINTGIYCFKASFLFSHLKTLGNTNAQGEYYLPDLIAMAVEKGLGADTVAADEVEEVMGINNRVELAEAERLMRRRINEYWMREGVTFVAPEVTYVEDEVTLGKDVVLSPGCVLQGKTVVGDGSVIGPYSRVIDTRLGNNVEVLDGCVIEESEIEDGCHVGPFAHIRPATILRKNARIGNFVEVKKSEIGEGSKANHLTYIGDAVLGKKVNIGAGTITCNYDGVHKHKTVIEDDVFVGSDTQLVAPVTVGRGALIAAGTTVTKDVPADSLAVSRTRQENKDGWAARKRKKHA